MPTVALWEKYHYWERLPIMFYSTPVVIPENIYRGGSTSLHKCDKWMCQRICISSVSF